MNTSVSVYLDIARLMAALLVFIVHANYERLTGGLPVLWRLSGFGGEAVMVFFVLSGFLIAYAAEHRDRNLQAFFVSRLARLWSVAIPAIFITVAADSVGRALAPGLYSPEWYSGVSHIVRIAVSVLFLNELWWSSTRLYSNGPFWSLGYEFWYYVLFAVLFYVKSRARWPIAALVIAVMGPKILLLLPVWLMGWALYRYRTSISAMPVKVGWVLALGSFGIFLAFRALRGPDQLLELTFQLFGERFVRETLLWSGSFLSYYVVGALFTAHLAGVFAILKYERGIFLRAAPSVRYLSGYTFALYLFHYPLLQLSAALAHAVPSLGLGALFVVSSSLIAVWVLGTFTERKKGDFKRVLLAAIPSRYLSARV